MPARLVQVTLINNSDFPIIWQDDGRPHGFWQEPWYPSNLKNLKKGEQGTWRLESGGIMTGVEGWALFKVDVPFASNVGSRTEFFRLWWERPYIGHFAKDVQRTLQDPRTNDSPHPGPVLTYVQSHGFGDMGGGSSPFEIIPMGLFVPLTVPIFLANEASAEHVFWVVEVLNAGTTSTLRLQVAGQGIIYGVNDNNDLMWYRHDGRNDGTFNWAFNEGKKVGNGWSFKHLFSGGDGIIYGVNDNNDLMWYRHDGRNDGTFNWAFNEGKKVGNGWSFKHLFSGGDGIIYGVNDNNDLMWYRHDGRNDGTFNWAFNEGKKVGNGWSFKHLFSGGDGIIYGVNDNNDLMWYRHDGRNDGTFNWAFNEGKKVGNGWSFKHLFSGGDGIIYGVNDNNDLMWYRHDGRNDGTFNWAFNEGKKVGNGWSFKHLFSG